MANTSIEGTAQERRLYDLIWKRTAASQMAEAQIEKTTVNIASSNFDERFIANGEVVKFDGFIKVYRESTDEGHITGFCRDSCCSIRKQTGNS